jgi:GTP-binding protein HflX
LARSEGSRRGTRDTDSSGDQPGRAATKAIVAVPVLPEVHSDDDRSRPRLTRAPEARLEEAVGLALAIDLEPVQATVITVNDPKPATLLGSGKVAELAAVAAETGAELLIVDHPLTPVQQRNLERETKTKVLDRTGLILEIFGRRARTKEGALQVELAHLSYQKGRLVRSWTHLERQRGGAGFLGGPGETQIEADRRALQEKILRIKRELEQVRRTRVLHRSKRRKVPFPVVAIVGYTNAGKSTLFNRMTGAGVLAEDMLFATLDPTLRRVRLPHGTIAILSDTVGFISDLPTHLVAAFRATLEEVLEADLILHLRDISDVDTSAQAEDVERILSDLGVDVSDTARILEVWNKVDLLDDEARSRLMEGLVAGQGLVAVSALSGAGLDLLGEEIERRLSGRLSTLDLTLSPERMHLIDWIYRHGEVVSRQDNEDGGVSLEVRVTDTARQEVEKRLGLGGGNSADD